MDVMAEGQELPHREAIKKLFFGRFGATPHASD